MTIRALLVFLFVGLFVGPVTAQSNKFITDSLDAYINREMKRWQIPGLAIAVVKDGKVVAMKGYGVKEIGKQDKVDENTLFQIASNTKAFTGTCIALLHHRKQLSLDDKISRWLPDHRLFDTVASREVTLRDVLSHRVGFKTFQGDFLHWNNRLGTDHLMRNLCNMPPSYSFRSRWGYYNMGFVTAGEVIKAVTDSTWQDYMTANILQPLNMTRTSPHFSFIRNDANKAKAYTLVNNALVEVPYANIDNIGASASLNSCVKDMANWMIVNMDSGRYNGRRVLPYEVIREAQYTQSFVRDLNNPTYPTAHFLTYGLGWFLQDFNGRKIVRHGGGTNGFVTQTVLMPQEKLGIVVLTNTDLNDLYSVLPYQIIESYLNMPYRNLSAAAFERGRPARQADQQRLDSLRAVVKKAPKAELPLTQYAGTYTNPFYGDITVTSSGKTLTINFPPHGVTATLHPLGGSTFLTTYSDVTWGVVQTPFTIENGTVKSVAIKVNDFIDYDSYEFVRKRP